MKSIEDTYDTPIGENDFIGEVKALDIADLATLFANDMKQVHLHAIGEHFDTIHKLAGEYYDELLEQADYFYEQSYPVLVMSCGPLSRVTPIHLKSLPVSSLKKEIFILTTSRGLTAKVIQVLYQVLSILSWTSGFPRFHIKLRLGQ